MVFAEFIELFETVAVYDLLEFTVGIVPDEAAVVEDHEFSVRFGIWLPLGQCRDVGISSLGELRPCAAHHVSEMKVCVRRVGVDVWRLMQAVETEAKFVAVD